MPIHLIHCQLDPRCQTILFPESSCKGFPKPLPDSTFHFISVIHQPHFLHPLHHLHHLHHQHQLHLYLVHHRQHYTLSSTSHTSPTESTSLHGHHLQHLHLSYHKTQAMLHRHTSPTIKRWLRPSYHFQNSFSVICTGSCTEVLCSYTRSKKKQFCETSIKKGKLSAELTAFYQCTGFLANS